MCQRFDIITLNQFLSILNFTSKHVYNDFKIIIYFAFLEEPNRKPHETPLQFLKRILTLELALSAWDFDSLTIAQQLTAIDRDLFLKVTTEELEIIIWQKSSKSAPNVSALVAFSHRTSCLIATEILKDESEKVECNK